MNNQENTAQRVNSNSVLPQDTSQALNLLIRLTNNLSKLADRESQALAQNDMVAFAILQDEKMLVTEQYVKASEEFRINMNTYRGAEKPLLDRLEKLQAGLGERTKTNNDIVHNIYEHAKSRTQSSLLAVQELGQDQRINYALPKQAVNENETSAHKAGD